MKVCILESLGISNDELEQLKKPLKKQGIIFEDYEKTTDVKILKTSVNDADAIILANMPLKGEIINSAPKLKFIDVAFTGVDHIDLEVARNKNIKISNASGYSNESVSELVLSMTLSILRNMRAVEDRCREGKTKDGLVGFELKGKTVGIIGLGKIGKRTAELFNAFGCTILATSKHKHNDIPSHITEVSIDELLSKSDIVVLHCPLNESTRGLINAYKLSLMKSSAILINVARGSVVNSLDLATALDEGSIAYAGIDVFDKEPPLDKDEVLLNCKNCLVTPHIAFATKESMSLRAKIVFENLEKWINGEQINIIL